jgi:RHH-type proline utilization regulon transcriptional repressor/proline dehydrogenase/delta 1-pyrroline-5-carboxylate dehydrogenase
LRWVDDWRDPAASFDFVLCHGTATEFLAVQQRLAQRSGPITTAWRGEPGTRDIPLERLVIERSVSINTAAAGGNASLMTLD